MLRDEAAAGWIDAWPHLAKIQGSLAVSLSEAEGNRTDCFCLVL
jgi:hypothetical protein